MVSLILFFGRMSLQFLSALISMPTVRENNRPINVDKVLAMTRNNVSEHYVAHIASRPRYVLENNNKLLGVAFVNKRDPEKWVLDLIAASNKRKGYGFR